MKDFMSRNKDVSLQDGAVGPFKLVPHAGLWVYLPLGLLQVEGVVPLKDHEHLPQQLVVALQLPRREVDKPLPSGKGPRALPLVVGLNAVAEKEVEVDGVVS